MLKKTKSIASIKAKLYQQRGLFQAEKPSDHRIKKDNLLQSEKQNLS